MPADSALDVEYIQGIHVVDTILWLDALRQSDLCFLSHAGNQSIGPHRKVLLTEATAALLRPQVGKKRTLLTPYRQRFSLGGLDLELFPSGHMPGAAQIRVARGDSRLVYTGDFQLAPAHSTQSAKVLECDVLVMKVTYGLPHQVFPSRQEVGACIASWAARVIESGEQPVLFASALGQAQELVQEITGHGLKVRAHQSIYRICRSYRTLGIDIPDIRCHRYGTTKNEVILYPRGLRTSRAISRLKRIKTAIITGQAVDPDGAGTNGMDEAFPFSMHADHPALSRYAMESKAEKIYLVGKTAEPLAAELRARGLNAWPLLPPEQIELFESGLNQNLPS